MSSEEVSYHPVIFHKDTGRLTSHASHLTFFADNATKELQWNWMEVDKLAANKGGTSNKELLKLCFVNDKKPIKFQFDSRERLEAAKSEWNEKIELAREAIGQDVLNVQASMVWEEPLLNSPTAQKRATLSDKRASFRAAPLPLLEEEKIVVPHLKETTSKPRRRRSSLQSTTKESSADPNNTVELPEKSPRKIKRKSPTSSNSESNKGLDSVMEPPPVPHTTVEPECFEDEPTPEDENAKRNPSFIDNGDQEHLSVDDATAKCPVALNDDPEDSEEKPQQTNRHSSTLFMSSEAVSYYPVIFHKSTGRLTSHGSRLAFVADDDGTTTTKEWKWLEVDKVSANTAGTFDKEFLKLLFSNRKKQIKFQFKCREMLEAAKSEWKEKMKLAREANGQDVSNFHASMVWDEPLLKSLAKQPRESVSSSLRAAPPPLLEEDEEMVEVSDLQETTSPKRTSARSRSSQQSTTKDNSKGRKNPDKSPSKSPQKSKQESSTSKATANISPAAVELSLLVPPTVEPKSFEDEPTLEGEEHSRRRSSSNNKSVEDETAAKNPVALSDSEESEGSTNEEPPQQKNRQRQPYWDSDDSDFSEETTPPPPKRRHSTSERHARSSKSQHHVSASNGSHRRSLLHSSHRSSTQETRRKSSSSKRRSSERKSSSTRHSTASSASSHHVSLPMEISTTRDSLHSRTVDSLTLPPDLEEQSVQEIAPGLRPITLKSKRISKVGDAPLLDFSNAFSLKKLWKGNKRKQHPTVQSGPVPVAVAQAASPYQEDNQPIVYHEEPSSRRCCGLSPRQQVLGLALVCCSMLCCLIPILSVVLSAASAANTVATAVSVTETVLDNDDNN